MFHGGTYIKKKVKKLESHCQKEQDPDPYQNVTDPEQWFRE